jgi:P27 family predicted phage terminase small subunit
MGRLPKPADTRQRPAPHPPLELVPTVDQLPVPRPPIGLLKTSVQRWETYWRSTVGVVARESGGVDLPALERWIRNVDEWDRAMRVLRRSRLVQGSAKQMRLNPLATYVAQREAAIRDAELAYGMTPIARLKLGIAVGQARLTAAQLNEALNDSSDDDDALNAEWEQA